MSTIAIISPNYHPRTCGIGDYSARIAQQLIYRGYRVVVLTRDPAEPHPDAPEVPVVGCPGQTPLDVVRAIARWLAAHPADKVIVQYTPQMFGARQFGSPAIPHLVRGLSNQGIPVTVVAHELFLPWSRRPDISVGALLHRLQLAALARQATRLTVTTESRARAAAPWFRLARVGQAPAVVRIGPNATPASWHPVGRGPRIGSFSTLAAGKRFDVVLQAFAAVAREVPTAELWLLGDMLARGDQMTRAFRRAVEEHPAADRIQLPGKQPLPAVAEAIASLHVFLFAMENGATTRSGTLPTALGSGVPVVAVRGVETDPIFVHDENVVFAGSLSGAAFAEATLRLHNDPQLARKVGAGGRRLYERYLAWPRIVDALLDESS